MKSRVELLFDEFAMRYVRGERPDVRDYLEQVRNLGQLEQLTFLIDRFLKAVPARESTEEDLVLMEAQFGQKPPLLLLRERRELRREAVVGALLAVLGLDPAKRDKLDRYYHELESGLLDAERVDRSVWNALGELLHANVRALFASRVPYLDLTVYYLLAPETDLESSRGRLADAEEPDEIDRLFTAGA